MSAVQYYSSGSDNAPVLKQRAAWTSVISSLVTTWIQRQQKRNEYVALLHQDPKILDDIGVTRLHLEREARKPFWRA